LHPPPDAEQNRAPQQWFLGRGNLAPEALFALSPEISETGVGKKWQSAGGPASTAQTRIGSGRDDGRQDCGNSL
jgi:hypothetical protein